jgi:hypothetical protein
MKVAELARLCFACGLLVTLFQFSGLIEVIAHVTTTHHP